MEPGHLWFSDDAVIVLNLEQWAVLNDVVSRVTFLCVALKDRF